jgi:hypothetical protein
LNRQPAKRLTAASGDWVVWRGEPGDGYRREVYVSHRQEDAATGSTSLALRD